MAEACEEAPKDDTSKGGLADNNGHECAVCLQTCVHPAQLPCGHIFCFLCVKGIAHQSKKCAMCRQDIPPDFVEHPNLLQKPVPVDNAEGFDGGYQWFYEGRNGWWRYDQRTNEDIENAFQLSWPQVEILICGELYVIDLLNHCQFCKKHPMRKRTIKREKSENLVVKGWWQYDERTSKELEASYKEGDQICELLIAGFLYIIDLENMIQLRRNDPSRKRKVKRDLASAPRKGIAGLRTDDSADNWSDNGFVGDSNELPVTPSNTPQSPTSGRQSPHEEHDLLATMERINSLQLNDADEIEQLPNHN